MRVAATSSGVYPVALIPKTGIGRNHDDPPRQKFLPTTVASPVNASAAFLAQLIAQELLPPVEPAVEALRSDAYRSEPRAAFEGLNFRAIA